MVLALLTYGFMFMRLPTLESTVRREESLLSPDISAMCLDKKGGDRDDRFDLFVRVRRLVERFDVRRDV